MSLSTIRRMVRFGGHAEKYPCLPVAVLLLVLFAASEPAHATVKPGGEPGANKCFKSTQASNTITSCSRAIDLGLLSGKRLAFAFYRRANAYNELRIYDRAIDDYNEAARLNPTHAGIYSNRGVAFMGNQDYDRAIESFDAAIELDPNHADAFSNRGVAYARKGDYDRAIQSYDEAIRLNPKHANAFFDRGNAYRRKQAYDRAIADYNEALRLNPRHANAFSNRGVAYGRKGEFTLAIQSYDEALRLNPQHRNALYNRGNAYARIGAYDRAVEDYDQVIQLSPKHAYAYSSRGSVRFFQGRFAAAIPDFSLAARVAPSNLYRILHLYLAEARAGNQVREALTQATEGLDLANWPGPILSMFLGKVPEQFVLDTAAAADLAEQPQRRCQALFYLGQYRMLRQQSQEAAQLFRQAVATNASALFEYEAAQAELERLGN